MTEYTDTVVHRARLMIGESFRLPARHPWRSTSSGAQGELVEKERTAAAKVEAELDAAFVEVCELVESPGLVTSDQAKAAAEKYARLFVKANEKSEALATKAEATKDESLALAEARHDAALSRLLDEVVPLANDLLDELTDADSAKRGLTDKNPSQRRTPSSKSGAKRHGRTGGKPFDQFVAALEEKGQPQYIALYHDQYKLWQQGKACVDVHGNDATGAPSRKIRVAHGAARRDVSVHGLVGG